VKKETTQSLVQQNDRIDVLLGYLKGIEPSLLQRATKVAPDPFDDQPTPDPFNDQPTPDPFTDQPTPDPFTDQPTSDPFTDQPPPDPFTDQPPLGG
jgi:hypothetical protein